MTKPTPPPHQVLPAAAIALLQRATKTPITADDPLARVKAIEQATKRVRQQYPSFFQEHCSYENQT